MHPKFTDASQTLNFSRAKLGQKFFVIGLLGLVAGGFLIGFGGKPDIRAAGYVAVALGFALCMYEMHRHFHPGKPMLSLAPDGVHFHIELARTLFIPWHELKAIRKIDVTDVNGKWPLQQVFRGVTALVVTNDFYARHLDLGNAFLRGPGWGNLFIPDEKNNVMQMALHEGTLPATSDEIYAAVETRWKAFRDRRPAKA